MCKPTGARCRRAHMDNMGLFLILALTLTQAQPQAAPPAAQPAQVDRVDRALELIHQQKYEMAYGVLRDLVKDEPTNARAFPFLAAMELQTGRLADAERHIDELVKTNPENADYRELSGQLYMARRDWKNAEAQWRWIIEQHPSSEQAHMQLAAVLLQQDRVNDALVEISRSLEINPRRSDARSLRGNILAMQGRMQEAALDWNVALVTDPDDTVALSGLGVYLRQSDPNRALSYAQRAVELTNWRSLGPMRVLAMVHRSRGEYDKAKAVLERAMLAFPNNEALAADLRTADTPVAAASAGPPGQPNPAAPNAGKPPAGPTTSPAKTVANATPEKPPEKLALQNVTPPKSPKPDDKAASSAATAKTATTAAAPPTAPKVDREVARPAPPPAQPSLPPSMAALSPLAIGGLTLGAAVGDLLALNRAPSPPSTNAPPATSKPPDSSAAAATKTTVASTPPPKPPETSAPPKIVAATPPAKPAPTPAREAAPSIVVASISPLAFGGLTLGAAFSDLVFLDKLPSPPVRQTPTAPTTRAVAPGTPLAPAPSRLQIPPPDLHWGALPLSTISPAFVYGNVPPPPAAARRP
jgi:tetratricopeptide (TPR) repeat protein